VANGGAFKGFYNRIRLYMSVRLRFVCIPPGCPLQNATLISPPPPRYLIIGHARSQGFIGQSVGRALLVWFGPLQPRHRGECIALRRITHTRMGSAHRMSKCRPLFAWLVTGCIPLALPFTHPSEYTLDQRNHSTSLVTSSHHGWFAQTAQKSVKTSLPQSRAEEARQRQPDFVLIYPGRTVRRRACGTSRRPGQTALVSRHPGPWYKCD
jgi:hypothetical protein